MNIDRFTIKMKEALQGAENIASRNNNAQIDNEHMFLAILQQQDGIAEPLLAKVGADFKGLLAEARTLVERLPKAYGGAVNIGVSSQLYQVLTNAQTEADNFKDEYVSTEHVVLALCGDDGAVGRLMKRFGITRDALKQALQSILVSQRATDQDSESR